MVGRCGAIVIERKFFYLGVDIAIFVRYKFGIGVPALHGCCAGSLTSDARFVLRRVTVEVRPAGEGDSVNVWQGFFDEGRADPRRSAVREVRLSTRTRATRAPVGHPESRGAGGGGTVFHPKRQWSSPPGALQYHWGFPG